jgi:hypothetical protein
MDGVDGGWAVIDPTIGSSSFDVAIDEDTLGDSERKHTTEQVAFLAFGPPVTGPPTIDAFDASATQLVLNGRTTLSWDVSNAWSVEINPGVAQGLAPSGALEVQPSASTVYTLRATGPLGTAEETVSVTVTGAPSVPLEHGQLLATDLWSPVSLGAGFTQPVVVGTPVNDDQQSPCVVRVRNVTSTGFEVRVERLDGLMGPFSADVEWMAIEEGDYDAATYGVAFEAVRYTSSTVDLAHNGWNGEAKSYAESYTDPVVLGQVMSGNGIEPALRRLGHRPQPNRRRGAVDQRNERQQRRLPDHLRDGQPPPGRLRHRHRRRPARRQRALPHPRKRRLRRLRVNSGASVRGVSECRASSS